MSSSAAATRREAVPATDTGEERAAAALFQYPEASRRSGAEEPGASGTDASEERARAALRREADEQARVWYRGELDHEAFLARTSFDPAGAAGVGGRQRLQTAEDPDAVLEMDDMIALLEIREVDLERGTHRLRMGRLEAPGALHLVSPEDLRVGDDDEL